MLLRLQVERRDGRKVHVYIPADKVVMVEPRGFVKDEQRLEHGGSTVNLMDGNRVRALEEAEDVAAALALALTGRGKEGTVAMDLVFGWVPPGVDPSC